MLRVDLLPKGNDNSGRSSDMVSFVPSIAQSAKSGDIRDLKETIEEIVITVKYCCLWA